MDEIYHYQWWQVVLEFSATASLTFAIVGFFSADKEEDNWFTLICACLSMLFMAIMLWSYDS